MSQPSRIVLDVTSFISAEEFILSQNRGETPLDPFARQCYAEVVQSLNFFDQVLVPHPTNLDPRPDDYGAQPRMLRLLFDLGIVAPLTFSRAEADALTEVEDSALNALETNGVHSLRSFVDKTAICDHEQQERGAERLLLQQIVDWSTFQHEYVRNLKDSHMTRICTADGAEDDPFGDWARESARSMKDQLQALLPDEAAQLYLTATLVRSRSARFWRRRSAAC